MSIEARTCAHVVVFSSMDFYTHVRVHVACGEVGRDGYRDQSIQVPGALVCVCLHSKTQPLLMYIHVHVYTVNVHYVQQ